MMTNLPGAKAEAKKIEGEGHTLDNLKFFKLKEGDIYSVTVLGTEGDDSSWLHVHKLPKLQFHNREFEDCWKIVEREYGIILSPKIKAKILWDAAVEDTVSIELLEKLLESWKGRNDIDAAFTYSQACQDLTRLIERKGIGQEENDQRED